MNHWKVFLKYRAGGRVWTYSEQVTRDAEITLPDVLATAWALATAGMVGTEATGVVLEAANIELVLSTGAA